MHSNIYEISINVPLCGDFIDADWCADDEATYGFADYLSDIHVDNRIAILESLAEETKGYFEWHFEGNSPRNYQEVYFTVRKNARHSYFNRRFCEFKAFAAALQLEDFCDDDMRRKLMSLIEDRFGVSYMRVNGAYMPFDRFMCKYADGQHNDTRFYVGGIIDYHC